MTHKDYTIIENGSKFNLLTVISRDESVIKGHRQYNCKCDCGTQLIVKGTILKNNKIKSCGCLQLPKLENKKFGKLTVIKFHDRKKGKHRWFCQCDCGKIHIVIGEVLLRGDTKSCGCLKQENTRLIDLTNKTFGALKVIKRASKIGARRVQWWCECLCKRPIKVFAENLLSGNSSSCGKCHLTEKRRKRAYKNSRPEQGTSEYKKWRQAVYKRDKYKCIACGQRGKINAHHLDGWHWYIAGRYLVNNGVTLCSGPNGCHDRFHDKYGKGKNTKEQFQQFLFYYYNKKLYEII